MVNGENKTKMLIKDIFFNKSQKSQQNRSKFGWICLGFLVVFFRLAFLEGWCPHKNGRLVILKLCKTKMAHLATTFVTS